MGIGEIAALTTAFLWTFSSFLWGRVKMSAFELNNCKNVVGTVFLAIHITVLLVLTYTLTPTLESTVVTETSTNSSTVSSMTQFQMVASPTAWLWFALSGVVGIVVGDTCFFRSLQILGPRRALVVATTSPLFAVGMGWLMLDEHLELYQLLGVLLTVGGISIVVGEKKGQQEALDLFPGRQSTGIGLGLCAAGCQSIGLAFSKLGMETDQCSPLEATFIRILFATICSLTVLCIRKQAIDFFKRFFTKQILHKVIIASALGTWLGIWFSQVAVQKTDIGIAQTLLSTGPLFAIPLVFLIQGHRTSLVALGGTLIAIAGIAKIVS